MISFLRSDPKAQCTQLLLNFRAAGMLKSDAEDAVPHSESTVLFPSCY